MKVTVLTREGEVAYSGEIVWANETHVGVENSATGEVHSVPLTAIKRQH
jgi:hypothetical protein